MSTHDLKLQQSTRESGERASVAGVVSNQDRIYTRTDKTRSQNVSGHEKRHPGPSAQHNKTESEPRTTAAAAASLHVTGQPIRSRDVQIRQIILLRPNKDTSKTPEDQGESSRFTTVISISLPTIRNKTATDTTETLQDDTDTDGTHETVKKTTNQHHTEQRDRFSSADTCNKLFKDGDGPKASFDEDSIFTLQSHHGLNPPNQGRDTGIQHTLGLHKQTQIAHISSQRHSTQPACAIQTKVSKETSANKESGANDCRENVPTTSQNHSNLTSLGNNRLKTSTEVLNQVLSLASSHTLHSESSSEPEQSLLNPGSAMLASALATVLAPPWSGRLRRPKQGGNEVQQEPQDYGHNVNPSTSLHQDRQQQSFLASQRQQAERVLQDPNDNDMQFTAGTSYSLPDWQKENNSPNVTTTIQSKRAIMKSSSVDTYRATMYSSVELPHVPTPLDTGQVPRLPHSEEHKGYRASKIEDQNEPFKSLSSKPTTSSLLLSLRRANLRRTIAETTQMQNQTTRSLRSLTLPSRSVLKNAQLYTSSVTPDDQAGDTLGSYSFPDTPSTEEISDTSNLLFQPRRRILTRTPLFLNKTETELSNNPEASIASNDEQQFPNSSTKSSPHEIFKAQQSSHSLLLRMYSNTDSSDPVELRTVNNVNQQNSKANNNPDTFSQNSSRDKINFNKHIPQTDFNVGNLKSPSTQNTQDSNFISTRSFTDTLDISPKKESFSVDGVNSTNGAQIYLNSKNSSQSSQSPMDLSSPLSPSRPTRGFHVPSIYSYLRESSPAVFTPNSSFTPSSHIHKVDNSSSPLQGVGEELHSDRKPPPLRFTFDISPTKAQEQASKTGSPNSLTGPAQSLPADFGRKSAPRLSTSPYSTLISSRHALNSTLLSSPPASKPHNQSNDTLTIRIYPIKDDPSPSPSMYKSVTKGLKKQLGSPNREQRTANTVQAYSCALGNHKPAQPCLSQTAPDASFVMESQSINITPHPKQQSTSSCEEHDGLVVVQLNKGNSSCKHRLSQKENTVTAESETPHTAEKKITDLQTHERLQESPNSKKGLFALRVKKDNVLTSDPVSDRDVVTPQYLKTKRNVPVLKTSSRIDQMLNRLKQTFSGKRSDNTVDTKNDKTTTQQPVDTGAFERAKGEEKCSESQKEPSLINDEASFTSLSLSRSMKSENTLNVDGQNKIKGEKRLSLTTDKASLPSQESLSPLTLNKSENTLNVDGQNRVTSEKQCFGSQWKTPNSSLTTDKASLSSQQSLSPLTLRKSENTPNVDGQNRTIDNKQHFGSQLKASNSSLTTDKASLPSQQSLSPLTLRKSENTPNVEGQNKVKGGKQHFGGQLKASNSILTTDKASLPSQQSLSPLTLRKSENTPNVEGQNKVKGGKQHFGGQLKASNSILTTDKAFLPSQQSLSPLTLRKSENTPNVDGQNKVKGGKQHFGSQLKASNSILTTDKASLPSQQSLSPLTLRKSENTPNVDGQNRTIGNKQHFGGQLKASNSSLTTDKVSLPSLKSSSPSTFRKSERTLNTDQHKRWSDEIGKRSYSSSPHRLKAHGMNRSATLPHYRNSSVGPPSPFYLFDYDSEDIQNDNVFYSPVSKKSNSLCESDNFPHLSCARSTVHRNLMRSPLSSSCANLKYGLNNGRSFSVSSVVSSRPSGPGRISTSSVSDLSSLDDCMPRGNYSRLDSPIRVNYSPTYGAESVTSNQSQPGFTLSDDLQDIDQQENSSCFWDDADPTPPPSPTFSSPRRISQAASVSSPIWTSPDSPSPRGILPSRSYSTSMTVFEESSSDTTTDDEYYLDTGDGDEVETEL